MGFPWAGLQEAPDTPGGVAGRETGCKGVPAAAERGPAQLPEGVCRGAAAAVWRYRARAQGDEPQQHVRGDDLRDGCGAVGGKIPDAGKKIAASHAIARAVA